MQCYSALTVTPKRPVAMSLAEAGMKNSTGFIKNEAEVAVHHVHLQQWQIKKRSIKTKAGFVGSGSPRLLQSLVTKS